MVWYTKHVGNLSFGPVVVLKELSMNNGTSPQTYTPCSAHMEYLIAEYEDYFARQNIRIPTDMKQLPAFYWLPKMHKNPIGSRFIAASSACTTKPLSQLLTSSLKLITMHFKHVQYCEKYRCQLFFDHRQCRGSPKKLKKVNRTKTVRNFDIFDFSTLYTNIPHDLLLDSISQLIN